MTTATLGKYRLIVELARGGMGIVYVAKTEGPGGFSKLMILKELKPELSADPASLAMFLEEARLAARLEHRNIVQTTEIGVEDNRHYIIMEYLQGKTLEQVRRSPGALSPIGEIHVLTEILQGLHAAHTLADMDGRSLGIVHRDVSPHNIHIAYDGQVKLLDFGIAKAADANSSTELGILKGKVVYMAPEQLRGTCDARSDVFSVGVLLWEAIAQRRMWKGETEAAIIGKLLGGEIPSIRSVAPETSQELVSIVERATASMPGERYPTAAAFRDDLWAYFQSSKGPSLDELGSQLATHFKDDRDKLRHLIEAQVQQQRREGPPVVGVPSVGSTPSIPALTPTPSDSRAVSSLGAAAVAPRSVTPPPERKNRVVWAVPILLLLAFVGWRVAVRPSAPPPAAATVVDAPPATVEGAMAAASPVAAPVPSASSASTPDSASVPIVKSAAPVGAPFRPRPIASPPRPEPVAPSAKTVTPPTPSVAETAPSRVRVVDDKARVKTLD